MLFCDVVTETFNSTTALHLFLVNSFSGLIERIIFFSLNSCKYIILTKTIIGIQIRISGIKFVEILLKKCLIHAATAPNKNMLRSTRGIFFTVPYKISALSPRQAEAFLGA